MGKDTKQKIITLTLQEIAAGHYATLSLRKLAKQVGLTTGAFYRHFANKDQLLTMVSRQLNINLVQEINQEGILKQEKPEEMLIALGKFLMKKIEQGAASMDFLFFQTKSSYETLTATSPLFKLTVQVVKQIIEEYQSSEQPEKIFYREWSFILGYGLLLKNNVTSYNESFFENTVLKLLNEG